MGMVIAEHDSYVNTVICQSFQCDSVYGGESAIIYQRLYLDLIGLMNDIFVPPTGWEPRRDLMNYWQMLTPRAREEIELYEKCLPRLQRAWQDNGPHQFGGALNEAIDDIETLAREVGRRGVRVNAVLPGFVPTDMTTSLSEDVVRRLRSHECLPTGTSAHDVANLVTFLISERAAAITGQALIVDAGTSA
jgi:hypothetical protein